MRWYDSKVSETGFDLNRGQKGNSSQHSLMRPSVGINISLSSEQLDAEHPNNKYLGAKRRPLASKAATKEARLPT